MTMVRTTAVGSAAGPETNAPAPPRARRPVRHNPRHALVKTGWNLIGLAVAAVMIFPVYWMISSSLKTGINLRRVDPQWFPSPISFDSYSRALDQPRFLTSLGYSLLVVTATALIALAIVIMFAIIQRKVAIGLTAGAVKG